MAPARQALTARPGTVRRLSGTRILLLFALAALAAPAIASADHRSRELAQTRGVLVAASPAGAEARVAQLGRSLCLTVGGIAAYDEPTCEHLPLFDVDEPFVLDAVIPGSHNGEPRDPAVAGGAVRGDVAAVEYAVDGAATVRFETVPAPPRLAGRPAGELRYFAGHLPPRVTAWTRRLLDRDGRIIAESDESGWEERRPLRAAPRLLRTAGVTIGVSVERKLDPARGDVTRRVDQLCFTASTRRSQSHSCTRASLAEVPIFDTIAASCAARPRLAVYGLAPRGTGRITAIAGDGRRVHARRARVPEAVARRVDAFVATLPREQPLTDVIVGGRRLGMSEEVPTCNLLNSFTTYAMTHAVEGWQPLALPGQPAVDAADEPFHDCPAWDIAPCDPRKLDVLLCLGAADQLFACNLPSPWLGAVVAGRSPDGRVVAGAVDPRIPAVRLVLRGGRAGPVVPTRPAPGYTGRYAGLLHFFAARLEPGQHAIAVDLLSPGGSRIKRHPLSP